MMEYFLTNPEWQFWLILAVCLVILEMISLVYMALGFAVAAVIMAGLSFFGLDIGILAYLVWAVLGLLFWYLLSLWYKKQPQSTISYFDSLESLPAQDRLARQKWANTSPDPAKDEIEIKVPR